MSTKLKTKGSKTVYRCTQCGAEVPKWSGQCSDCGAWNSLIEDIIKTRPGFRQPNFSGQSDGSPDRSRIISIADVQPAAEIRMPIGFDELDRVLGGGIVQGSVVLLGGDPGIGKSTLLLQSLAALASRTSVLYVTGEESLQQVSLSVNRIGAAPDKLRLLAETNVEQILALASQEKPTVMVVDSIQTIHTNAIPSAPGAVSQVRESAAQLVAYAKQTGTALFLIGHVTKEGTLAGPRILEHMVDTVLYFEGDSNSRYRVIRAVKNRFGAVNEMGIFAMTDKGLREVTNPSAIFISRHEQAVPGSVIMVTREGSRPILVEVQALVAETHLSNPRRVAVGLDQTRLAMLLAVMHRHGGIAMFDQDVFVNVVGGMRITETAVDLAVVLAALSSLRDQPLPIDLVVFGEIGLSGEIRPVQDGQERLRAAAHHGFKHAVIPKDNAPKRKIKGMNVIPVSRLTDALTHLGGDF